MYCRYRSSIRLHILQANLISHAVKCKNCFFASSLRCHRAPDWLKRRFLNITASALSCYSYRRPTNSPRSPALLHLPCLCNISEFVVKNKCDNIRLWMMITKTRTYRILITIQWRTVQLIPVFPFILPSENNVPRVWVVFNRPRKRDRQQVSLRSK